MHSVDSDNNDKKSTGYAFIVHEFLIWRLIDIRIALVYIHVINENEKSLMIIFTCVSYIIFKYSLNHNFFIWEACRC